MQILQWLYWHVLLPCFCLHRTLTSLIVPISILPFQNSFDHISWIYYYTHNVCHHNSCTVANAALLLCNIETQTGASRSGFEVQACGYNIQEQCKCLMDFSQEWKISWNFGIQSVWNPAAFWVSMISACVSKQPAWLPSFGGFLIYFLIARETIKSGDLLTKWVIFVKLVHFKNKGRQ